MRPREEERRKKWSIYVARERMNKILMTQKVLSKKTFYPKIYEKGRLIKLVKYVRHQGLLHLFDESTPKVLVNKIREFYYPMEFLEDGLSLYA